MAEIINNELYDDNDKKINEAFATRTDERRWKLVKNSVKFLKKEALNELLPEKSHKEQIKKLKTLLEELPYEEKYKLINMRETKLLEVEAANVGKKVATAGKIIGGTEIGAGAIGGVAGSVAIGTGVASSLAGLEGAAILAAPFVALFGGIATLLPVVAGAALIAVGAKTIVGGSLAKHHMIKSKTAAMTSKEIFDYFKDKIKTNSDKNEEIKELTEGELPKNPKDCEYAFPDKKRFPLFDEAHVKAAIRFFNYAKPDEEAILAKKIKSKMKKYGIFESSVGEENRLKKYL